MLFQRPWWKCRAQRHQAWLEISKDSIPHMALCVWDISKHGCMTHTQGSSPSMVWRLDTLPKEQQRLWRLALKLDEMSHLSWSVDQARLCQLRKWVLKNITSVWLLLCLAPGACESHPSWLSWLDWESPWTHTPWCVYQGISRKV